MTKLGRLCLAALFIPSLAFAAGGDPPTAEASAVPPEVAPADATPAETTPGAGDASTEAPTVQPVGVVGAAAALENPTGFKLGLSLDQAVGTGTFSNPRSFAYADAGLSIMPSYGFAFRGVKLAASARASLGFEYTPPDSENARRFGWSDLRLGLSAPRLLTEQRSGIALTPGIGLTVPISIESRYATTITVARVSLKAARTFGKVDVGLEVRGSRGFHASPLIAASANDFRERDAGGVRAGPTCRASDALCAPFDWNTKWSASTLLDVGVQATEKLWDPLESTCRHASLSIL